MSLALINMGFFVWFLKQSHIVLHKCYYDCYNYIKIIITILYLHDTITTIKLYLLLLYYYSTKVWATLLLLALLRCRHGSNTCSSSSATWPRWRPFRARSVHRFTLHFFTVCSAQSGYFQCPEFYWFCQCEHPTPWKSVFEVRKYAVWDIACV